MKYLLVSSVAALAVAGVVAAAQEAPRPMPDVRLMTVDPGHFHAALVQKEMYPGVAPRVDIYAPLGSDLYEHLEAHRLVQPPWRAPDGLADGDSCVARFLRAHAPRTPGQCRRAVRAQSRQDRSDRGIR